MDNNEKINVTNIKDIIHVNTHDAQINTQVSGDKSMHREKTWIITKKLMVYNTKWES